MVRNNIVGYGREKETEWSLCPMKKVRSEEEKAVRNRLSVATR